MRAAFLLLLAGCASAEPYWVRTHEPIPVRGIVYVERPCGLVLVDGCANYSTGNVELRKGMSESLRWCVEHHERKHFAGYGHERRANFVTDCGNGERL